jgi:hypothetical protein
MELNMASLSHTEEIVAEYLKYIKDGKGRLKYLVSERIEIPTRKGGHSDIDILAVGKKDVLIIQTKQYTWHGSKKVSTKKILQNFEISEKFVRQQNYSRGRRIRKILCYEHGSKTIAKDLAKKGIKSIEIQWIMFNFLFRLGERMYGSGWLNKKNKAVDWEGRGKVENNLVRTLIFLVEWEFIDKNELKEYNSESIKELKKVGILE